MLRGEGLSPYVRGPFLVSVSHTSSSLINGKSDTVPRIRLSSWDYQMWEWPISIPSSNSIRHNPRHSAETFSESKWEELTLTKTKFVSVLH